MGILILLFFMSNSAKAEGWLEPQSTSEEWANSESNEFSENSDLLRRYFDDGESSALRAPEPTGISAETEESVRAFRTPDAFTRYNLGGEDPFRLPSESFPYRSSGTETNIYEETLKPYDMMKQFRP